MSRRGAVLPWVLGLLWCAVLLSAAGAVYSKYRARALFVRLERLNQVKDQLDAEWGRLQLEQSAWSSYAFVERVASDRLHMFAPDPRQIAIVVPAPMPAEVAAEVAASHLPRGGGGVSP